MAYSRAKELCLILTMLLGLTGCRAHTNLDKISGEWQCEDIIYLKCSGNDENGVNPTGWVKLNDVTYNYTAVFTKLGYFDFLYDEGDTDINYDYFWSAHMNEQFTGNIKLKIFKDCTGTYAKDTIFILKKMESQSL